MTGEKNKKRKSASLEDLGKLMNPDASSDWELARVVKVFPDRKFGYMDSKKHEGIHFRKRDLINNNIPENNFAENTTFRVQVGFGDKGAFAKKIKLADSSELKKIKTAHHGNEEKQSFDLGNFRLPKDTTKNMNYDAIDNFSLRFNKAAYCLDGKFEIFRKDKKNKKKILFELKAKFGLKESEFRQICERQKLSLKNIFDDDLIKTLNFKPEWRLILGLGNPSIYEVSMTLHHVYGFPYIPGSAVKGIARGWVIQEFFENYKKKALKDDSFCYIFGSPKKSAAGERQGCVTFYDAYPTSVPKIEKDVMTPHYIKYYMEGKAPGDYYEPKPIQFLTVGRKTCFQFILAQHRKVDTSFKFIFKNKDIEYQGNCMEVTEKIVKSALTEHGLGAKTAVGYGRMAEN